MMEAIYYTLVTAIIATFVSTIVGTITAIGLSKSKRIVKEVVQQINDLPIMNPRNCDCSRFDVVLCIHENGERLFNNVTSTYCVLYAICHIKCYAKIKKS